MSKAVHSVEDSLESYVTMWRENSLHSCSIVNRAGFLVSKCFTAYLNWKQKHTFY